MGYPSNDSVAHEYKGGNLTTVLLCLMMKLTHGTATAPRMLESAEMPRLEVHQLNSADVYKDIIRVNQTYRFSTHGDAIKEGRVCLVRANGRKGLAVLRGYQDSTEPQIRMDDYTRGKLDLRENVSYEFEFKQVGFVGQLRWAWDATEIG